MVHSVVISAGHGIAAFEFFFKLLEAILLKGVIAMQYRIQY